MNYYQVLQVDRAASQEVIEAAYRRLARMYHPDINKQPDAVAMMQRINEAYSVVGNPTKRYTYDQTLDGDETPRSRTTTHNHGNTGEQSRSTQSRQQSSSSATRIPVACANCGAQDATLRIAAFPYVISVVLVTFRRAWGGIYCKRCRTDEMTKAKLVSFLFGWWGIPFGIFYTLGNIFGPSGGRLPRHENAEFLKFLGAAFLGTQKRADAAQAFRASLEFEWDTDLAAAYKSLFGHDPFPEQSKSANGRVGGLLIAVALTVVAVVVLSVIVGSATEPTPGPAFTATPPFTATTAFSSPTPTVPAPTSTPTLVPTPIAFMSLATAAQPYLWAAPKPTPTGKMSPNRYRLKIAEYNSAFIEEMRTLYDIHAEMAQEGAMDPVTWNSYILRLAPQMGRVHEAANDIRSMNPADYHAEYHATVLHALDVIESSLDRDAIILDDQTPPSEEDGEWEQAVTDAFGVLYSVPRN